MKKLKDSEISLLMDFTGIPVSISLQALFTFSLIYIFNTKEALVIAGSLVFIAELMAIILSVHGLRFSEKKNNIILCFISLYFAIILLLILAAGAWFCYEFVW